MKVEESRTKYHGSTGVFVRAEFNGKWGSFDIAELDKPSLHAFLKSRGGDNLWAENVVEILLGHGHFEPAPATEQTEKGGLSAVRWLR